LLDLEGHGREPLFGDVDVSRTVGWFTTRFPVRLELAPGGTPEAQMRSIKRQLAEVPRHGIGYGLLRYLGDGELAAIAGAIPAPEVSFNYLGRMNLARPEPALLQLAGWSVGATRDLRNRRRNLIDVTAQIAADELQFEFTGAAQFSPVNIRKLADGFKAALRSLSKPAQDSSAMRLRPAEFPLVSSTQEQLDRLAAKFGGNMRN
jgi:non-ribosomal peptide synthase protein (TIGR01720 family)